MFFFFFKPSSNVDETVFILLNDAFDSSMWSKKSNQTIHSIISLTLSHIILISVFWWSEREIDVNVATSSLHYFPVESIVLSNLRVR